LNFAFARFLISVTLSIKLDDGAGEVLVGSAFLGSSTFFTGSTFLGAGAWGVFWTGFAFSSTGFLTSSTFYTGTGADLVLSSGKGVSSYLGM
jgi:hypothetical protein